MEYKESKSGYLEPEKCYACGEVLSLIDDSEPAMGTFCLSCHVKRRRRMTAEERRAE